MATDNKINHDLPSPETLAGIYVCVSGEEDTRVLPGQIPPQKIPLEPPKPGPLPPEATAGIYVCVEAEEIIPDRKSKRPTADGTN